MHCGGVMIDQALFCPHCLAEDYNNIDLYANKKLNPADITCKDDVCPNCSTIDPDNENGDYMPGHCLVCGWKEGMELDPPDEWDIDEELEEKKAAYLRDWKERAYPKE